MKTISKKSHAILDYGSVILLIASPWLFNFEPDAAAKTIVIVAAVLILVLSLLTDYDGGFIKVIPIGIHLMADIILGLFLIASPWLFQFSNETFLFHVIMGMVALIAGTFTNSKSVQKFNNRSVLNNSSNLWRS